MNLVTKGSIVVWEQEHMELGEEKAEGLLSEFVDAIAPTPCL